MKNAIYYLIIIISTAVIAAVGFQFYLKLKPSTLYDTSELTFLNVGGINYKTTGAIPSEDVASQKALKEVVQLGTMGLIRESGFQIYVSGPGTIYIRLSIPYDQNKQNALTWLKSNGFSDIPQDQINFQEVK